MTPTQSRTKTDRGYKYDHSRWICSECLRANLCTCPTSEDTTVVDLLAFEDDAPTQVYVRAAR
jgi:hypothetical protein